MISFKHKGNFKMTENFLINAKKFNVSKILKKYAQEGVKELSSATPINTGETANSWDYTIKMSKNSASVTWTNSKMAGDTPLVILLQYGHGTRNGGYVQGRDFINPAIRPILDKIADEAWKEVTKY